VIRAKQAGAKSLDDPFYWRWLNFGRQERAGQSARERVARISYRVSGRTVVVRQGVRKRRALSAVGAMVASRFLEAGAARLTDALRKIEQVLGPQVQRIVDKQSKD
jgi:hypothetical protein